MNISIELFLSFLTAIGLGSILGAYFQYRFQYKKDLKNEEYEWKRKRYAAIIIQMLTVLQFEKHGTRFVKDHRPDLNTLEDFIDEIKSELLHGIIFANDEVIYTITNFIKNRDYNSYTKAVVAMRKDLWGKKTKIKEEIFKDIIQ